MVRGIRTMNVRHIASLIFTLAFAGPLSAHPVDDLLKHVPSGTAVCFVVRDLSGRVQQLNESPFASWFETTAFGKRILANMEWQRPEQFEAQLKELFGLTPDELIRDVFGDAIVFAYTPGPGGKADRERGLILVKPKKPDVAARVLARLDEIQKQSGELVSVAEEKRGGIAFTVRKKKDGGTEAYRLQDGVLAFASDETSLKSYLDWHAAKGQPAAVAASLARLKANESFVTIWFDPRAFDAAFRDKVKTSETASDKVMANLFAGIWSAVDDFALHAEITDRFAIRVSTRFAKDRLPVAAAGLLPFQPGETPLWSAIPPDAIFAMAGRFAVATAFSRADRLAKAAGQPEPTAGLTRDLGPIFGKDKWPAVVEAIGPDWGLWITAPERTEMWSPDWTFVLRVRPDSTKKVDTASAFLKGIESAAHFAKGAYNSSHSDQLELNEETIAGQKVRIFDGGKLPQGVRPCFAVKGGYFVFASSPERIAKFEPPAGDAGTAIESTLIRISGSGLRAYLARHADSVATAMATANDRPIAEMKAGVALLIESLEPFDKIELMAGQESDVTRLSLVLTPAKSLKK
jgi:hypothetical protein